MSRAFKRIITRSLWPILVSSQLSHFLFSQLRIPQILQFEFQFISNRWKGVGILRAHSVWKLTKMSYLKFSIFVLLIVRCLVTLFDRKLQGFLRTRQNWPFSINFFHSKCKRSSLAKLWDFFCDFQTLWDILDYFSTTLHDVVYVLILL